MRDFCDYSDINPRQLFSNEVKASDTALSQMSDIASNLLNTSLKIADDSVSKLFAATTGKSLSPESLSKLFCLCHQIHYLSCLDRLMLKANVLLGDGRRYTVFY